MFFDHISFVFKFEIFNYATEEVVVNDAWVFVGFATTFGPGDDFYVSMLFGLFFAVDDVFGRNGFTFCKLDSCFLFHGEIDYVLFMMIEAQFVTADMVSMPSKIVRLLASFKLLYPWCLSFLKAHFQFVYFRGLNRYRLLKLYQNLIRNKRTKKTTECIFLLSRSLLDIKPLFVLKPLNFSKCFITYFPNRTNRWELSIYRSQLCFQPFSSFAPWSFHGLTNVGFYSYFLRR